MTIGIWVLGDQLNATQAALASVDPAECRVLLVESSSVLAQRLYHRQKLVLVWSAMRHFAAELQQVGWLVDHRQADSFAAAVRDWIREHGIRELRIMDPADRGFRTAIERLQLPVPLVWLPWAAALGVAAHLAGDAITKRGLPGPAGRRVGPRMIRTGGPAETLVCCGLALAIAAYPFRGHLAAFIEGATT